MPNIANDFRGQLTGCHRALEETLREGEDIICTFYLRHGSIRMFLGGLGTSENGMFLAKGIKEDGKHAALLFGARDAYFFLEVINSNEPRRIGFCAT